MENSTMSTWYSWTYKW